MRFGIFDHLEQRRGASLAALYEERLALLERADAAGFWCYHKAEHHFIRLDAAPSSNVFLAAASQRTRRLRFGPLVYLLPFYDPLRLAEEICALDHLSRGRLEVGVGKGISPAEHMLWGNPPEEAMERFLETLAVVRQALVCDHVEHRGAFFDYPGVPAVMEPYQPDGPPLWYAGNFDFAGRHRLSTVVSGPVERLAAAGARYRELVAGAVPEDDWNPGCAEPTFAVKRHLFVAETDAAAHARVARAYPVHHANLAELWKRYRIPFPTIDPSFGGDMHAAMAAEDLVIGSPATVAAHLERVLGAVDTDYLIGAFAWGDLEHAEVMDSLERFIEGVMPAVAASSGARPQPSRPATSAQNTSSSVPSSAGSSGTSR